MNTESGYEGVIVMGVIWLLVISNSTDLFTCSSELPEAKYSPLRENIAHVAGP